SAGVKEHNDDIEAAQAFGNLSYRACMSNPGRWGPARAGTCDEERKKSIATWTKDSSTGKNVAFISLAPIPLGWLAGYILLMVWRIQVAGFQTVFPWRSLPAL